MVLNIDLAQTLLDLAGVRPSSWIQGRTVSSISQGKRKGKGRKSTHYRYRMHDDVFRLVQPGLPLYGLSRWQEGSGESKGTTTEGTSRVIRGGMYLYHSYYCNRYRVAARSL